MKIILDNGTEVEFFNENKQLEYLAAERLLRSIRFQELHRAQKTKEKNNQTMNGRKCLTCGKKLVGKQRTSCGSYECNLAQARDRHRSYIQKEKQKVEQEDLNVSTYINDGPYYTTKA